jgi:hypothetical protein
VKAKHVYITLRDRCCDIILLKVHAPINDKIYVMDSFYEEGEYVFDKFHKQHIKMLLGDINVKVGREDIFKQIVGNDSLHEIYNNNGISVINVVTSKNLSNKIIMFPHCNIHKFTWTSPINSQPN